MNCFLYFFTFLFLALSLLQFESFHLLCNLLDLVLTRLLGFISDITCVCCATVECKDKSGRFANLVSTKVDNARSGGKRKSKNAEIWAANAFDEWRRCHGYSTAKSIADMSEEDDLHVFVDMLFKITLQVWKLDGGLYPPTS